MSDIIDALLLLSRVCNLSNVPYSRVAMAPIIEESLLRLRTEISESGAAIYMPEAWPEAYGYGPWIEEIWVNYLSNAIKYGGSPPRIEIGVDRVADGAVRFWVSDNGPGLAAEEQRSMFTRLHTDRALGHGLGLSIVQRIVERLGGTVGVSNNPDGGACFSFTLPACQTPPNKGKVRQCPCASSLVHASCWCNRCRMGAARWPCTRHDRTAPTPERARFSIPTTALRRRKTGASGTGRAPSHPNEKETPMANDFKAGDHVEWETSQGTTTGTVQKKLTAPTRIKGHHVAASEDDPQYLMESDTSGEQAAHKPGALKKRSKH